MIRNTKGAISHLVASSSPASGNEVCCRRWEKDILLCQMSGKERSETLVCGAISNVGVREKRNT